MTRYWINIILNIGKINYGVFRERFRRQLHDIRKYMSREKRPKLNEPNRIRTFRELIRLFLLLLRCIRQGCFGEITFTTMQSRRNIRSLVSHMKKNKIWRWSPHYRFFECRNARWMECTQYTYFQRFYIYNYLYPIYIILYKNLSFIRSHWIDTIFKNKFRLDRG